MTRYLQASGCICNKNVQVLSSRLIFKEIKLFFKIVFQLLLSIMILFSLTRIPQICYRIFFSFLLIAVTYHYQWPKACIFIKKETLALALPCEFCEISKNTVVTEYLRWTAFDIDKIHNSASSRLKLPLIGQNHISSSLSIFPANITCISH